MPDLTDLHASFSALEQRAPSMVPPHRLPGARRRRRRLQVNAVAVTLIAAVIAAGVGTWVLHRPQTSAGVRFDPSPLDITRMHFRVDPITGYTARTVRSSAAEQSVVLDDADPSGFTTVTRYTPGAWHPTPRDATVVTVEGAAGSFGRVVFDAPASSGAVRSPGPTQTGTGLVWPDQFGGWMNVARIDQDPAKVQNFEPLTLQKAQTVASAVHVGVSDPLRLPVEFGALLGLQVQSIDVGDDSGYDPEQVVMTFGPAGSGESTASIYIDPTSKQSAGGASPQPNAETRSLAVNGFSGYFVVYDDADSKQGGGGAQVSHGGLTMVVASSSPRGGSVNRGDPRLSFADVTKVLGAATVCPNPADLTTWFEASDALRR